MYTLIFVDFNTIQETRKCIDRCLDAMGTRGAGHIVIVENGTNEGVLEALSACYGSYTQETVDAVAQKLYRFQRDGQQIIYCHSGENMGYARGNNLGAQIAKALWNDPYYIVSNNDVCFEKPLDLDAVEQLFARDPSIGVIGPAVRLPSGIQQSPQAWAPAFRRLIVDYWRRFAAAFLSGEKKAQYLIKHCNDVVPNAPSGVCDWVSGCFMFLRAETFHNCGMFDEHTFLYAEEMILSRRLEAVGSKVWFCRELEIIHNHAQTTKKSISIMKGRELDFQAVWYYYKTYTPTSALLLRLAQWNFAVYKGIFHCFQKLKGNNQ